MHRANIAVCGCGPAGLAVALLLHRAGHRVRVFERFDTPRPVGSGLLLQPTGLGVLAELGLVDRLTSLGSPIDRIFGRVSSSNRIVLDVRYAELVRAETRGKDAAVVTSDGRRHGGFDLIVDALGANSPLAVGIARRKALPYGALWVNLPCSDQWPGLANAREQRYRRARHRGLEAQRRCVVARRGVPARARYRLITGYVRPIRSLHGPHTRSRTARPHC